MTSTSIFFAADIHGSEVCFRKFLSAGKVYKADVIILNGDLTGKVIVPIVDQPSGAFEARFLNRKRTAKTDEELEQLKQEIRNSGYYPYVTSADEAEVLETNHDKADRVFSQLMTETMGRWIRIAEERLKDTKVKCFVNAGNDDIMEIDQAFTDSSRVVNPEGKNVKIDENHEMITCGYSNVTPWNAPRDIPEEELAQKIEAMISHVENMPNCIFNFHCPPYDSGLDTAPKLDETLRPIMRSGGMEMIPVGSKAVRDAVMKHQPLLGLHGHIHESRGVARLGRTLCLNPGSEYGEGILRGALVTLDGSVVKRYQLTQG